MPSTAPDAPAAAPIAPSGQASASADFAWRVHTVQEAWTAKVDVKASVLLALEGGLFLATISMDSTLGQAPDQRGWGRVVAIASMGLLLSAIASAAGALLPLIGTAQALRREYPNHLIHFGHLRHWDPGALANRLQNLTAASETAMLARQLIVMSRLNWWKHRCLQVSIALTFLALAALCLGWVVRTSA